MKKSVHSEYSHYSCSHRILFRLHGCVNPSYTPCFFFALTCWNHNAALVARTRRSHIAVSVCRTYRCNVDNRFHRNAYSITFVTCHHVNTFLCWKTHQHVNTHSRCLSTNTSNQRARLGLQHYANLFLCICA